MNVHPPNGDACPAGSRRGLWLLLLLGAVAMAAISPVDYSWTAWLLRHDVPAFSTAMARSVFEGAWPGGTDPTAIYLAAVVLLYLGASRRRASPALAAWRARLGFMMSSALIGGLLFVHSVRWVLGRYRPGYVIKDGKPFTAWYEMGPQFATDAHYRGSFPSGHTALVFCLMGLAYVLANSATSRRQRVAGWAVGAATLAASAVMSVGRAMSGAHWLSDCLASIVFGWLATHWLYHYGLRVREHDHWHEAWVCGYAALAAVGGVAFCVGVRSVALWRSPWLIVIAPVGAALAWHAVRRLRVLFRRPLS